MTKFVIARSAAQRNDEAIQSLDRLWTLSGSTSLTTLSQSRGLSKRLDRHGLADARPRDDRRGWIDSRAFTIVEVAMAVLVLALALTTSITAMQHAFLQFDTARNLEVAANILQCEMEKERLFTWTQASSATYAPVIDASFARNPAITGRFTLSRSVASLAAHSGQVLQITLTVTWRGYNGRSLTRSYTSYYTQGGLYAYFYNP